LEIPDHDKLYVIEENTEDRGRESDKARETGERMRMYKEREARTTHPPMSLILRSFCSVFESTATAMAVTNLHAIIRTPYYLKQM